MTMAKGIMIVDGQRVPFDGEKNVLSVIRKAGIDMPTFCYYSELSVHGACRMCIVENVKTGKIDASCSMEPKDGLEIRTNTARLLRHRRMILELMLASHDCSCTTCAKSGNCRLQALAQRFGISRVRFPDTRERYEQDNTSLAIFRDPNKCILCGDCVRVCEELQGQGILNYAHRGSKLQVMPAFDKKLDQTKCVGCGQCTRICAHNGVTVTDRKATIDHSRCVGCGRCIAVCPRDAIRVNWDETVTNLNRKIAEYAQAVVDGRPCFHISLVQDISPNCDCHGENDAPILPDIGMFASFDPVALDQACADACLNAQPLPNSQLGQNLAKPGWNCHHDNFKDSNPNIEWKATLEQAEKIGMGTRQYTLKKI